MKKTTASLCLLISIASAPALAERNPADPYEGYTVPFPSSTTKQTNTSFPLSHAVIAK